MIEIEVGRAIARFLSAQLTADGLPLCGGVFTIFGHGNVGGLGPALFEAQDDLPVYPGHNEQGMAHAATAFAKASRRRRFMACTTSIGPGATNLVTAAATAHVNRLPLLLLPADVFANRQPDPVLQQVEDFCDARVSANECLRPVSRYFDRIERAEQLPAVLLRAMQTLMDPAGTGPVTLALPQDVQTETLTVDVSFFAPRRWSIRRPGPDERELQEVLRILSSAKRPLVIAGGGVKYSEAEDVLSTLALRRGWPVAETQAGKGSLADSHPCVVGGLGVTGTAAANQLAAEADVIIALGTRLSDFTTASRTLFSEDANLVAINVAPLDAHKHGAVPLVADLRAALERVDTALPAEIQPWAKFDELKAAWSQDVETVTAFGEGAPSDAQVIGVVQKWATPATTIVAAAGGLPGELHKLWRASGPDAYHLEYGYSCMGYELAGALGVKLAQPEREVVALLGDGSYLMLNSEIATAVAEAQGFIAVVLDNGGFGCIHRLQQGTGGGEFRNLRHHTVDIRRHAQSLGAVAVKANNLDELKSALDTARADAGVVTVIVIETDPAQSTAAGGAPWTVPMVQTSSDKRGSS